MSTVLVPPPPVLVSPPTSQSTLPIVELVRANVEADGKQIRLRSGSKKRAAANCSFGNYQDHLTIDAWAFFHAAKKTELTTTFNSAQIDRRALCFSDDLSGYLDWNPGNLRRTDRNVFSLEDFSEAGLAGRFGEAIAYLTMVKWGYVYWDRIAVLWNRAAAHSGMTHPEQVRKAHVISSKLAVGRPDLEPDFAFEKQSGDVGLMESKGSFVHPLNDNPSTKSDLRHALRQLQSWSTMIAPTPSKSYAIGTYFRDQSDRTGDPSLITYVDPPGTSDDSELRVKFPSNWIRRGNYGAWLFGMGYAESGNALRRGIEMSPPERQLPVVRVGGREFAVTLDGVVLNEDKMRLAPIMFPWLDRWSLLDELRSFPRVFLRDIGIAGIRVTGIEVSTLKMVEKTVLNSASDSLMHLDPQAFPVTADKAAEGFSGSVLPDGTLYGQIDPELLFDARMESFRL